jgi:hypothetical protein
MKRAEGRGRLVLLGVEAARRVFCLAGPISTQASNGLKAWPIAVFGRWRVGIAGMQRREGCRAAEHASVRLLRACAISEMCRDRNELRRGSSLTLANGESEPTHDVCVLYCARPELVKGQLAVAPTVSIEEAWRVRREIIAGAVGRKFAAVV